MIFGLRNALLIMLFSFVIQGYFLSDLQAKVGYIDLQRLVADSKEEIAREDRELVAIILEKADGVLKKVAKRGNYTIILKDPNVLAYLDEKVDITDEVIKELNAE